MVLSSSQNHIPPSEHMDGPAVVLFLPALAVESMLILAGLSPTSHLVRSSRAWGSGLHQPRHPSCR